MCKNFTIIIISNRENICHVSISLAHTICIADMPAENNHKTKHELHVQVLSKYVSYKCEKTFPFYMDSSDVQCISTILILNFEDHILSNRYMFPVYLATCTIIFIFCGNLIKSDKCFGVTFLTCLMVTLKDSPFLCLVFILYIIC